MKGASAVGKETVGEVAIDGEAAIAGAMAEIVGETAIAGEIAIVGEVVAVADRYNNFCPFASILLCQQNLRQKCQLYFQL